MKPLLTLKNRVKTAAAPTVVSSVVVTRKRKYEVPVSDSAPTTPPPPQPKKEKPKKPVAQRKPKSPPPPPKPLPLPTIPRFVRVITTLTALRETWPELFNDADPRLWEVGIRKQFWKELEKKHSRSRISEALDLWKNLHPAYIEKLKTAGTPRWGLDGESTTTVTEEHAKQAQENY